VGVGKGEVKWEDLSMEKFFVREENFHEGGAGFFSIIYKKKEKINIFFNWK